MCDAPIKQRKRQTREEKFFLDRITCKFVCEVIHMPKLDPVFKLTMFSNPYDEVYRLTIIEDAVFVVSKVTGYATEYDSLLDAVRDGWRAV